MYLRRLSPLCIAAVLALSNMAWGIDEAVLSPTNKADVAQENKEFNDAMSVWFKHRYADGEKLLGDFARKHFDSEERR